MRILCAAAIALSVGLWTACSSATKADAKADRAAKLAERKKQYDAKLKELLERLKKADNPADARGIQAEIREEALLMAGKVLTIAEGDPKDEVGFDASAFIIKSAGEVGAGGADVGKALGIVAEHHVANAKVKDLLIPAVGAGEAGEKFLKTVSEKATDKPTKATALFLRGYLMAQVVDDIEDDKKQAATVKEAIGLLEEAVKLAPDAKFGDGTIGKYAKTEIEGLNAVLALAVGKPAPDVETKLLDGKTVKLSDYKGKVVLLDIWATWCGPCKEMIPHERELMKKMKGKPFEIISVSADDKKETLQQFLAKESMPWTHWWDGGKDNPVLSKFRVRAFPTLYLIDHAGVIRYKWVGVPGDDPKSDVVDKAVEELLKAAEKAKG